jgi:ATP phosphoribosyltransferase
MTIKIALPNKGSLAASASEFFLAAGFRQRSEGRDLVTLDPVNEIEFYYLRPRDIATYVGNGEIDLGVTGRDLLEDSGSGAREILDLDFGRSTMRFAAPIDSSILAGSDLRGKRIATSYPTLVGNRLKSLGVEATIIELDGAIESSVGLGVADLVADVVATGSTLRQAGLKPVLDPIMESSAILIGNGDRKEFDLLIRRLQSVIFARQFVIMDYDISSNDLKRACDITPGFESPTISPLQRSGWFAVRAMVPKAGMHQVMDELYEIGARGILVTEIHSCRL